VVLEAQTGLVIALFGLLGLPLLLIASRIRQVSGPWLAFFLGVLLYLILHDLTDAFLLESALRVSLGDAGTLSLIALGLLIGGGAALFLLRGAEDRGSLALGVALLVGLLLALHAASDGFVVGIILQTLTEAQVVEATAIALQAVHRALEGGLLVVALLLAGIRMNRIFAGVVFVGLPLVATAALAPFTPDLFSAAISVLLAFLAAGVLFVLLLRGSWTALASDIGSLRAVPWLLVGFLIALVAHNLAH
jgi:zinc transporter ZupT